RNGLAGDVVEAMMSAIEQHYPLGRRWFVRKASVLGLDRLQLGDQYAPIGSERRVEWTEAISMVDDSLRDFSPRFSEIFRACLDRGHVDVRAAARRRAADRQRGGRLDAGHAPRRPRRERDGLDLPPDDDGALRDSGLRDPWRGEGTDERPALGDVVRGERALLRRLDR